MRSATRNGNAMILPEHMSFHDRNQRLYETLKGWGLYVTPIPEQNDPSKINRLEVACGLPFQSSAQQPAEASVSSAMQGAFVGETIEATQSFGCDVINFPTIKR